MPEKRTSLHGGQEPPSPERDRLRELVAELLIENQRLRFENLGLLAKIGDVGPEAENRKQPLAGASKQAAC